MTKIKKYAIYLVSFLCALILLSGGCFTAFQIQCQKQNNYFFSRIEKINDLIKNDDSWKAQENLLQLRDELKSQWWNRERVNNKKAVIDLMLKKLGNTISEESIENYISKSENYPEFNLVKECLLRLFFLEKSSYTEMQKFRWEHGMQRSHLLTTLRADLNYKSQLPKQLFNFYLRNIDTLYYRLRFEDNFIIMAAS